MTAVEWLVEQLELYYNGENELFYSDIVKQANAIFEQQIKDAYKVGIKDEYVIGSEKYYNQTFNQ
jgi:formylmethanofuran dehydrogenase subunit E